MDTQGSDKLLIISVLALSPMLPIIMKLASVQMEWMMWMERLIVLIPIVLVKVG